MDRAIITHAHSDHARFGHKYYLSHKDSVPVLKLRLGPDIAVQAVSYGEKIQVNGVTISLHPAGHIIGSSQVRLEYKGEVWVVSGDYKLEEDGVCEPFEPVKCHTFITECTFGLPLFTWKPQEEIFADINNWWKENKEDGKVSVLFGYSLGKAQRLINNVDKNIGPIFLHGAIYNVHDTLIKAGLQLPIAEKVSSNNSTSYQGALILAPSSALGSPWMKRFKPAVTANASGWMNLRGAKRRRPIDRGFILSDHADWTGLLKAVEATGATRVYATHGYKSVFARYLNELGYEAYELNTQWEGEALEDGGIDAVGVQSGQEEKEDDR